jgi:hypothetical protein
MSSKNCCSISCFGIFTLFGLMAGVYDSFIRKDIQEYGLLESPTHYNRIVTHNNTFVKEVMIEKCIAQYGNDCYKHETYAQYHLYVVGLFELNNKCFTCDIYVKDIKDNYGKRVDPNEKKAPPIGSKSIYAVNKETLECDKQNMILYPADTYYAFAYFITLISGFLMVLAFMIENDVRF